MVKNLPAMQGAWVQSLGWEDPLEEGMATHSSIFAWRIPKDRGAWWATVHSAAKTQIWLKWPRMHMVTSTDFFFFTSTDFYYYPVQFNCSVMSDFLWPHARLPCPSPAPGDCSNSCLLNQWCHPTISSSVVPFSPLQSFPALGSFQWVCSLHQVAKVLKF